MKLGEFKEQNNILISKVDELQYINEDLSEAKKLLIENEGKLKEEILELNSQLENLRQDNLVLQSNQENFIKEKQILLEFKEKISFENYEAIFEKI